MGAGERESPVILTEFFLISFFSFFGAIVRSDGRVPVG